MLPRADPEILKKGALCALDTERPPWLADEKNLGFSWSKNAKITLESISFWRNFSFSISTFSPYIMKACQ